MISLTTLLNEINKFDLYVVEEKAHNAKVNNKPVYFYNFYFFIDKNKAEAKARELKNTWKNKIGEAKIKTYVPDNLFNWVNVTKYKSVKDGIEGHWWNIRGGTKMNNPSTGKPIIIDVRVDDEVGEAADKFFKN